MSDMRLHILCVADYLGSWSYETSWELYNNDDNLILQFVGAGYAEGQTVTSDVCLPDGCYHRGPRFIQRQLERCDTNESRHDFSLEQGSLGYIPFSIGTEKSECDFTTRFIGCPETDALNYVPGALTPSSGLDACISRYTFITNKESNEYFYFEPAPPKIGAPLMMLLHFLTGTAADMASIVDFRIKAMEEQTAIVYPEGTLSVYLTPHWNHNFEQHEADDLSYLTQLSLYLQQSKGFPGVFPFGISNGMYVQYTLACFAPTVFPVITGWGGKMGGRIWETCPFPPCALPFMERPCDFTLHRWTEQHTVEHQYVCLEMVQEWAERNNANKVDVSTQYSGSYSVTVTSRTNPKLIMKQPSMRKRGAAQHRPPNVVIDWAWAFAKKYLPGAPTVGG